MNSNTMSSTQPQKINSYIILDLETTGLPSCIIRTNITELSILCLERSHIETHVQNNHNFIPRVIQKVNLCIYPKEQVSDGAAAVSGLTKELLRKCKPFNDQIFDIISKMISMMEPPVCILAHNGNRFDFPVLRSEIENIGRALPHNTFCADTLMGFRVLLLCRQKHLSQTPVLTQQSKHDVISELDTTIDVRLDEENGEDYDWGSDSLNIELNLAAEEAERRFLMEVQLSTLEDMKIRNETTPKPNKSKMAVKMGVKGIEKQLFKDDVKPNAPKSFRLKDVYTYLTGKELYNAHQADSDTHALLECVVALGPPFLEWVDRNCRPFSDVRRLW